MTEIDPYGADPHAPGAKLDGGKVRADLLLDFSKALKEVAKVSTFGAQKYTEGGWITVPNGAKRYKAALLRHLLEDGVDPDSNLDHLAHVAWNALAILELTLRDRDEQTISMEGLNRLISSRDNHLPTGVCAPRDA